MYQVPDAISSLQQQHLVQAVVTMSHRRYAASG
jgi:hypothetical protein